MAEERRLTTSSQNGLSAADVTRLVSHAQGIAGAIRTAEAAEYQRVMGTLIAREHGLKDDDERRAYRRYLQGKPGQVQADMERLSGVGLDKVASELRRVLGS